MRPTMEELMLNQLPADAPANTPGDTPPDIFAAANKAASATTPAAREEGLAELKAAIDRNH